PLAQTAYLVIPEPSSMLWMTLFSSNFFSVLKIELLSVYANAFSISFNDCAFSWLKRCRNTTVLTAVFFTFFIFRISSSVCIFLMYHFFRALAKNSSFIFFSGGFLRLEKNKCAVCAVGFFSSNVEFSTIFCIMHNGQV